MKKRWQDLAELVLGSWLIISPFFLPRILGDDVLMNNSLVVGLLIQVAAVAAIMRPNAWKEWFFVILGAWLISSSYFLNNEQFFPGLFGSSAFGLAESGLIVGVLVMIGAAVGLFRRRSIREMDKPNAANI